MIRISCLFIMALLASCTTPKESEEPSKPEYTRTYRSQNTVDINMPEMEELGDTEEAPAEAMARVEADRDEEEPVESEEAPLDAVAITETDPEKEAPPEAVARTDEGQGEKEPVPAEEKPELPAWEEEFIKDMEGIKEKKLERSDLTGDRVQDLAMGDEIQLGEGVAARMLHEKPELENRAIWEYVTCLGSVLAENSLRSELPYHFVVLDEDGEINAFAAPGGFIFLTSGAVKACANEAELASLLAHELAHVGLRHGIRMLDLSDYRLMSQSIVGEMDEAFDKSGYYDLAESMPEELKKVEAALSEVADQCFREMLNPFSREMELEADAEGMRILKATGYNPRAAITLLERVAKASDGTEEPGMMALRSHPPTAERIESLKRIAAERGYGDTGVENRKRFEKYVNNL